MSRIAKNSIKLPENTTCSFENNILSVKGKLGTATLSINNLFTVKQKESEIHILPKKEKDEINPIWGTTWAHVANAVNGVDKGFSKTLVLTGTGFRASVTDTTLKLQLGFSHDINYDIPKDVKIECPKQNIIKITSINREKLCDVSYTHLRPHEK